MAKSRKERMQAVRAAAEKVRASSDERPAAPRPRASASPSGRLAAPRKSAALAAFLALVFPGAGMIYAGQALLGVLFVPIGLLALAGVASATQREPLSAVAGAAAYLALALITVAVVADQRQ